MSVRPYGLHSLVVTVHAIPQSSWSDIPHYCRLLAVRSAGMELHHEWPSAAGARWPALALSTRTPVARCKHVTCYADDRSMPPCHSIVSLTTFFIPHRMIRGGVPADQLISQRILSPLHSYLTFMSWSKH